MHAARLKFESDPIVAFRGTALAPAYVGCSGWFYWNWRGLFYPAVLPTGSWFTHYAKRFDTVEINASFYSWPTLANIQAWKRQAGKRKFVYTVKDCELITHAKRFKGTKTLVKDFGLIADILGEDGLLPVSAAAQLSLLRVLTAKGRIQISGQPAFQASKPIAAGSPFLGNENEYRANDVR